jgi:hypothetical protein
VLGKKRVLLRNRKEDRDRELNVQSLKQMKELSRV